MSYQIDQLEQLPYCKIWVHIQEVKTLTDEVQESGYKEIEWNSTNNFGNTVASGVYFYRLEETSIADPSKTFTQVRKMLLLR